jgi:hypothetical protein
VNPRDPYLAWIEAVHIAPPQTVASIIRCILKKEGRKRDSSSRKSKLFEAPSSLAPLEREKHLAITNGSGPGSDPRKPLALLIADAFNKTIYAARDNSEWTECASDWILAHFFCEDNGKHCGDVLAVCEDNINMGAGKRTSDDYRTILMVVHATLQNTKMMQVIPDG